MIPNIFISSTIKDLFYLRDAIRETIYDLGYNPIMSEYGDIGYSTPSYSAENSCYVTMKSCQLAIFIIGSNYGSIGSGGLSITHNEYKTAKKHNLPVIFLVHDVVMNSKSFYDKNIENADKLNFDGMDKPIESFKFINEFISSATNNGFIVYKNISDARISLKKQLAHLFGELLTKIYNPLNEDIKTVLTEITALRHHLIKGKENQNEAKSYATAIRFLNSPENKIFGQLFTILANDLDRAIEFVQKNETFADFLSDLGVNLTVDNNSILEILSEPSKKKNFPLSNSLSVEIKDTDDYNLEELSYPSENNASILINYVASEETLIINKAGHTYFNDKYNFLKSNFNEN
ncbi:hypothetical protein BH23BAC1_BH23BAC1_22570 [soil metagenome]